MCEFCSRKECTLTKEKVVARGPIIENNAAGAMRAAYGDMPQTYFFKGVPAYYSLSALFPDESDKDPHAYTRFIFDEDVGLDYGWEWNDVDNPLGWQTEIEFLAKIGQENLSWR